jgi:hypothetical protein
MVHVIQLALGAFRSIVDIKYGTQSWEAHEHGQQFGQNAGVDSGKSQRLRTKSNARINKVSAMRSVLVKIIEKVGIDDISNVLKLTFI